MTDQLRDQLGKFGIWRGAYQVTAKMAAEIEQAGFGALWLGSSPGGDLAQLDELLDATSTLTVGTSIVNIWKDGPHEMARAFARAQDRHPGRFVLGVGVGHPEATRQYERPYDALVSYVEAVRGNGHTSAPFSYAGPLTEMVLLGCLATRFPKTDLKWDTKALKFTNNNDANQFVRKTYRKGFEAEGL